MNSQVIYHVYYVEFENKTGPVLENDVQNTLKITVQTTLKEL
jgi:hypothetical protein